MKILKITIIGLISFLAGIDLLAQTTITYEHFPYQKWTLIGFPVTPANPDPALVFNNFGTAGQQWRFSRWNIAENIYIRYGEPEGGADKGDPPAIIPGRGYWFYQNSQPDAPLSATGTLAPTTQTYYIPVDPPTSQYRGLNMVANPFNAPIDWKNTTVKVYDGSAEVEISLIDANNLYLLDNHAYRWDVTQQVYVPYSASLGGRLNVWDGFWVEQLSSMSAELVVYRVNHLQGGSNASARFYNAMVGGKLDYLGKDFARETDRFDLSVSGAGTSVDISTSVKTVKKTTNFPLTKGHSVLDANGIQITLVDIVAGGAPTYRFQVSTPQIVDKIGLKYIAFDFKQGQIVAPVIPKSGYNLVTTVRVPMEGKKAPLSLSLGIPPNQTLPKSAAQFPAILQPASERDWFVPLRIQDANGSYQDLYNGIGISSDASDGYDIHDAKNFTPMKTNNDFVDLYFPHHDTTDLVNYWWERPDIFCYDVRGDSNTKVWKMNVAAYNIPNRTLTISWESSSVNSDWNLSLCDLTNQQTVNMLTQNSYTFTTPNKQYSQLPFTITATFLDVVGINPEPRPNTYPLLKAYPNPFNATTHFQYFLSQPGRAKLIIYNTLGQIVQSYSANHEQSGSYSLTWNGQDQHGTTLPSGIYFCRLVLADKTQTLKVILLR